LSEVDLKVAMALPGSALFGFGRFWRKARGIAEPTLVGDVGTISPARQAELASTTASGDVFALGRLLGGDVAKDIVIGLDNLPDSLLRRPELCTLLDIAVGAGKVEMSKYLLEFHELKPSRETLKQSLSTGVPELIRLIWQRVDECDREGRVDLLQVSADFHHESVLGWLFRDSSLLERELFGEFALERRLADALVIATRNGLRLWSSLSRALVAKWPPALILEIVDPPEGLSVDCGWRVDVNGRAKVIESATCEWWRDSLSADVRQTLVAISVPPGLTTIGRCAQQLQDA
jgi:hypothetical protein